MIKCAGSNNLQLLNKEQRICQWTDKQRTKNKEQRTKNKEQRTRNKQMKYESLTQALFFSCAFLFHSCFNSERDTNIREKQNPDILFILVDDLGWSDLGCYGHPLHQTPNIDQLAAKGMRFINAYASAPVSSPTRGSILTGKNPVQTGITDWIPGRQHWGARPDERFIGPDISKELGSGETTMAEILKSYGYQTAFIGKWHLGDTGYLPNNQGFDMNIAGNKRGAPPSYFYPFKRGNYALPQINSKSSDGDYLTDQLTDEALHVMDTASKPLFLFMSFYSVHIPLQAKDSLIKKYKKLAAADSASPFYLNPVYAAMVETMDRNVGRLLNKMRERRVDENTIVFLTSDNGGLSVEEGWQTPATNNYPLRHGKGSLYEGGIREPLIISWPKKITEGEISDYLVISHDLYPTMMEMVNKPYANVDGRSFLDILISDSGEMNQKKPLFWHYPHYSNQGGEPSSAIRKGKYKLIFYYEDEKIELYNLESDISERENLADMMPKKKDELLRELNKWKTKNNAKHPSLNPDYNPDYVK